MVETIEVDGQIKDQPIAYTLQTGQELIYDNVEIALSMIAPKWDGSKWVETGQIMYTPEMVADIQMIKLQEINTACQNIIFAGVDVETSQGTKHFRLAETDQINFTGMATQLEKALLGQPSTINLAKGVPYHSDGELCCFWTPEDFVKISTAAAAHVFYHQTYCNHLRQYVKKLSTVEEIQTVTYGMELPPELMTSMTTLLEA